MPGCDLCTRDRSFHLQLGLIPLSVVPWYTLTKQPRVRWRRVLYACLVPRSHFSNALAVNSRAGIPLLVLRFDCVGMKQVCQRHALQRYRSTGSSTSDLIVDCYIFTQRAPQSVDYVQHALHNAWCMNPLTICTKHARVIT